MSARANFLIFPWKKLEDFPPMIKGIKAAFFCEYLQEVDLKGSKTIPVIIESSSFTLMNLSLRTVKR